MRASETREQEYARRVKTFAYASEKLSETRRKHRQLCTVALNPLNDGTCEDMVRHHFAMVDCFRQYLKQNPEDEEPRVRMPKVAAFSLLSACLNKPYDIRDVGELDSKKDRLAYESSLPYGSQDRLDPEIAINFNLGMFVAIDVITGDTGYMVSLEPEFGTARTRLMHATRWYYLTEEDEQHNPFFKHSFRKFKQFGEIDEFTTAEIQHINYLISVFELLQIATEKLNLR